MTLIRDALLQARMNPYLERATHIAIVSVSGLIGYAATALAQNAGVSPELSGKVGTTVGVGTGYLLHEAHKSRKEETKNLTVFYQEALRLRRTPSSRQK